MVLKCHSEEDGVTSAHHELLQSPSGTLCFIKPPKYSLMGTVVTIGWVRIFCHRCRIGLETGSKMSGNAHLLGKKRVNTVRVLRDLPSPILFNTL